MVDNTEKNFKKGTRAQRPAPYRVLLCERRNGPRGRSVPDAAHAELLPVEEDHLDFRSTSGALPARPIPQKKETRARRRAHALSVF